MFLIMVCLNLYLYLYIYTLYGCRPSWNPLKFTFLAHFHSRIFSRFTL